MTTEEALKIFTIEEIDALSLENLKQIKKEFLLQFQLTEESVVDFNGHLLDKNAILEIFEDLNKSLDKHLEKQKYSVIDSFIKSGDIKFLLNAGVGNRIVKAIITLPQKREVLISKLADIITDTITKPSQNREELIRQIQKVTDTLPLDYEEKSYAKSLRYLRQEVESIKTRYDNPFYDNSSLKLEPEMQTMVDVRFLNLFQLLPDRFHFLAYEYSLWCYDFIIKLTKNRETNYSKYPIDALLVIRNAALIASQYYEENENLKLSSYITTLLKDPSKLVKNDKSKFKIKGQKKANNSDTFKALLVIGVIILYAIIRYIIMF